ncbi:hypothetical protein [Amycolatopsis taiwanensis]|uniref:hypothetical protein n=1 Tax=Amycolatopsis taiwanensis TaxID=342230 RepID=UPI00048715F4|nr:hypothetical protein [Amycolatopsis taiwanensis]
MGYLSGRAIVRCAIVVGCVGLAVAGCDSPGGPPAGPASGQQRTTAAGDGAVYQGPSLPGLEAQPLAHLKSAGTNKPYVVGDAFAFVDFRVGDKEEPSGSEPATVTFYDAATGQKRATADVPLWDLESAQVGEFGGGPAIFLHGVETVESDGLSRTRRVEHQVGFDPAGRKVADATWDEDDDRIPVLGWSATKATNNHLTRTDLVVHAADGSARLTLPADHGSISDKAPVLVTIDADIALVRHTRGSENYLAAYDLARPGAPLWTSEASRPPAANTSDANVVFISDGKLGLVCPAGSGKVIVALQDMRTGAMAGATPAIDKYPGISAESAISEADNVQSGSAVLALTHASSNLGSVAVSLADGHILWQQTGDQEGFRPQVVVGGAVYGSSSASPQLGRGNAARPSLALNLATGQVMAKSLTTAPIAATDQGYAIVPEIGEDTSGDDAGATGGYWIFRAAGT